jgi:hypothetical protein
MVATIQRQAAAAQKARSNSRVPAAQLVTTATTRRLKSLQFAPISAYPLGFTLIAGVRRRRRGRLLYPRQISVEALFMDRLFSRAALAALLSSLAFVCTGCGGGSADAASSDTASQTVSGVSTPSSVSVVTAKNAD